MTVLQNQQTQRVYVDYFVKQIERTEGLITAVQHAVVAPAPQIQALQQESPGGSRDRRKPQAAY